MLHGSIKGFEGLSAQRTSRSIGNGTADHDRQGSFAGVAEIFFDSKNGSFGIQRIKDGFDQ
ncbi:hypothetical protein D9M70_619940 [compost metagenome]